MAIVTGVAGTHINAVCTVSNDGQPINQTESTATALSMENDLATIKSTALCPVNGFAMSGACTIGGNLTIAQSQSIIAAGTGATLSGQWTFSGGSVAVQEGMAIETGQTLTITSGATLDVVQGASLTSATDVSLGSFAPMTITGATNATPIVITTSSAHGLYDGAQILVASVGGNTNANGTWVAQVTGHTSTTFALVGSSGNSAYTSGGTATKSAQVAYPAPRTDSMVLTSPWNSGLTTSTSGWKTAFGTVVEGFQNVNPSATTQQQWIGWDIELPQGASILTVTVYFQPPSGHGGVPATPPSLFVGRVTLGSSGTTTASLGSASDPNTGSVGAYEVYTELTVTLGTAEIVDNNRCRYIAYVSTETGTNALDGFIVFGARVGFSTQTAGQF